MSEPGPTHQPYGHNDPYGQQPSGQAYPYGQSGYGQQPGHGQPAGGRRPATVTAAAWITIVFSAITGALMTLGGLFAIVGKDEFINEIERQPDFRELDVDLDQAFGVLVALVFGLAIWCFIALVLAIFVLRRSNVARILLVISSAVAALLSLLMIASGISIVWTVAALATIVLLFVGGANDWFKGPSAHDGTPSYGQSYPGQSYPGQTYPGAGQDQYGASGSSSPYGQSGQSGTDNPYGQPPADGEGGGEHPSRDYPGR